MAAALTLTGIGHAFLGRTILDGISLTVNPGEVVALAGPSGCGKSTLAHIAAGVLAPLRGHRDLPGGRCGMVFQDPRLLPWATAADNIALPLRLSGVPRRDRRSRVEAVARQVALLPEDLDRYPAELSGGMRQRTAIARALADGPPVILFDEPFTALDPALKRRMQDLVTDAAATARFAALFITHDLQEAARIAHRIVVMNPDGRGLTGECRPPGQPGQREDGAVFAFVRKALSSSPLFAHLNDLDERRLP